MSKKLAPKLRIGDTKLETWFERDRAHVALRDLDDETLLEFWDEDVQQAIEDGFLDPKNYHRSIYDYAVYLGVIREDKWRANPQLLLVENPGGSMRCTECGWKGRAGKDAVQHAKECVGREPRHDVLCQCGWGRLAMPESQIPEHCPVCGDTLRRENAKATCVLCGKEFQQAKIHPGYSPLLKKRLKEHARCPECVHEAYIKQARHAAGDFRLNPEDYTWECSQCGPGPVRRCDGCRRVARLSPLAGRRGTFLPSEAALNLRHNGSAVLDPKSEDFDEHAAVRKADKDFKQFHGGPESSKVVEWETPGVGQVVLAYLGRCPALSWIHSGPACDECEEHDVVVEGKHQKFFGHRVEFANRDMPYVAKDPHGKAVVCQFGIDRIRKKYGDLLGKAPLVEYVVPDVRGSTKSSAHWVHEFHKPLPVLKWSERVGGFLYGGNAPYEVTSWFDK